MDVGDHPAAGGLRADEIESSRGGPVSEQARAIAQDDGVDEQAILVGEAVPASDRYTSIGANCSPIACQILLDHGTSGARSPILVKGPMPHTARSRFHLDRRTRHQ